MWTFGLLSSTLGVAASLHCTLTPRHRLVALGVAVAAMQMAGVCLLTACGTPCW